jgi:hypothetical protein
MMMEQSTNQKKGKDLPETAVMRPDGPVSAEALARLAFTIYATKAPDYGIHTHVTPFDCLPEQQQRLCTEVARLLLKRVDARVRYILHGGYLPPFVGMEKSEERKD